MPGIFDFLLPAGNMLTQRPNSVFDEGALTVPQIARAEGLSGFGNPNPMSGLGGIGGVGSGFGTGLGFNIGTGQLALSGLGSLANLFSAFQAQGLAKKQFDFTRNVTNTNLANQIKSYNTAISDRARSRGVAEGQSREEIDDYISRNSLSR